MEKRSEENYLQYEFELCTIFSSSFYSKQFLLKSFLLKEEVRPASLIVKIILYSSMLGVAHFFPISFFKQDA